ncbi:Cytochrome b561 [BD1-7 clade bacterium]|uniref:Cytochrome b561 n=1 Tax=BD1-7 clade bacterium TaxID=2029982 RepID=A0A5S9PSJ2_9GAMM|nr:Cytochrome b561 [BD1-7 clade bacterium]
MKTRLSIPTIGLHWLTALLFLGVFFLGLYMEDLPKGPAKFEIIGIHKSLGLLVLAIAALRLAWRIKEGALSPLSTMSRKQQMLATGMHHLLLLMTLLMPLSGVVMSMAGGRPLEFFGVTLITAGQKIEWLSGIAHTLHVSSVIFIFAVVGLHILAALKHQFMVKDGTLARMLGR